MYTFFGDYEKHDLVLTVAAGLSLIHDKQVSVVSDSDRNYRYFGGDVSGVLINTTDADIVLYDCHKAIIGPTENVLFACSDYTKHSVDVIKSIHAKTEVRGTFLCTQECDLSEDYVKTFLSDPQLYSYEDDTERRIGLVYEGRLRVKKYDDSFLNTVGKFLSDMDQLSKSEVKEFCRALKRGDT